MLSRCDYTMNDSTVEGSDCIEVDEEGPLADQRFTCSDHDDPYLRVVAVAAAVQLCPNDGGALVVVPSTWRMRTRTEHAVFIFGVPAAVCEKCSWQAQDHSVERSVATQATTWLDTAARQGPTYMVMHWDEQLSAPDS